MRPKTLYETLTMPNPSLIPGERSIRHQVVIPESLDRKLRSRAVLEGDLKISEVIRAAIEAYLDDTGAATCKACAHRRRMCSLPARCPKHLDNTSGQRPATDPRKP